MANFMKRVASAIQTQDEPEDKRLKPDETSAPNEADGNNSDDDMFADLDNVVNRVINKCDEVLEVGQHYFLFDIYEKQIEGRTAIVGGCKKYKQEDEIYIWMPAGLTRNFNTASISTFKTKLDEGKKAFFIYKGIKVNQYGSKTYDISYVPKPKN